MANPLVDKFLASVFKKPDGARGNLVFALDATASREQTWDTASHLQSQMFNEVAAIGSLDVQAVYFRGAAAINAECKASNWLSNPAKLAAFMTGVTCRAGLTQITRVLDHVLRESNQRKIGALVYVGDDCEEPREHLVPLARRLADLKIPIFLFTGGAFCRFDQNSSRQLGELLRAVAAFAVGGVRALEKQGSDAARLLLRQIR